MMEKEKGDTPRASAGGSAAAQAAGGGEEQKGDDGGLGEVQRLQERIAQSLQRTREVIDAALLDAKRDIDEIEKGLLDQLNALKRKEERFETEQAELIEFKRKLSRFASSSSRVKLDIGGTRFVTTRQTLCK